MAAPVGVVPTYPRSGPAHSIDVTAPTGPMPTIPPAGSAHAAGGQQAPRPIEQRLPPVRHVDDAPTNSNPHGAQTWSAELNPNVAGADQSWSMGNRTFNDGDERPDRRKGGGGWFGWVLGLGVVALLGGGVGVAWSLGAFDGDERVASKDASGDETGVIAAESGPESGPETPDLPSSGETGASVGETGAEGEAGQDTGAAAEGGASTGGGDSGGSGSGSGGDSGGSGGDSGGSGGDSGGSGGDSGGSGGDSGGSDGGGSTPPKKPPFEPTKLVRSGSLYTTKARGPNGTFASAKNYCRSLARSTKHGLSGWRLAKVTELQSFRNTGVDKLRYWSSETDGRMAKAVTLMNGKVEQLAVSEQAVRAFCVSRR